MDLFTNAARTLDFIEFKSGKTMNICKVDKVWSRGLPISPDHRWILFSLEDEPLNTLMLVDNFR